MNRTIIAAAFTVVFLVLFASPFAATSHADVPGYKVPAAVSPSEKYLFFFHNYYVETKGPDGECKYYDLLKAFSGKGFTVISELRPKDASVVEYAAKAAIKIQNMLQDGLPPEHYRCRTFQRRSHRPASRLAPGKAEGELCDHGGVRNKGAGEGLSRLQPDERQRPIRFRYFRQGGGKLCTGVLAG